MIKIWLIFKRELSNYFVSPMAYAIIALFLFVNGTLFTQRFILTKFAELDWLVSTNRDLLIIIAPLLTMRLISEERRSGTFEMVMTSPLSESQWIIGKYLGVLAFYLCMVLPTFSYVSAFYFFGATGVDFGMLGAAYLGLVLHGALFLAVGMFFSSTTKNQVLAALFTLVFIFMMTMIPSMLTNHVPHDFLQSVRFLSFVSHSRDFSRGIVGSRDVIYLVSVTSIFLYLSVRTVSWRRWVA